MGQQAAIVECSSPVDEWFSPGLLPESRDKSAYQQLLCKAHAGMWRHFEAAKFDKTESAG